MAGKIRQTYRPRGLSVPDPVCGTDILFLEFRREISHGGHDRGMYRGELHTEPPRKRNVGMEAREECSRKGKARRGPGRLEKFHPAGLHSTRSRGAPRRCLHKGAMRKAQNNPGKVAGAGMGVGAGKRYQFGRKFEGCKDWAVWKLKDPRTLSLKLQSSTETKLLNHGDGEVVRRQLPGVGREVEKFWLKCVTFDG